jgi:hypothetical protein
MLSQRFLNPNALRGGTCPRVAMPCRRGAWRALAVPSMCIDTHADQEFDPTRMAGFNSMARRS